MRKPHLLVLLGLSLLLFACSHDQNGVSSDDETNRAYIDGIVPHHQMAGIMADEPLAGTKKAPRKL